MLYAGNPEYAAVLVLSQPSRTVVAWTVTIRLLRAISRKGPLERVGWTESPTISATTVAGFVDGEGSFDVPIRRQRDRAMPLRAGLSFNVSRVGRQIPELLREVFGTGTVRERADGVVYFEVTRPSDLMERVFPFFERYPLRGPKANDLAVFEEITVMVQSGDHLSPTGLRRFVALRSPMNRGGRRRRTDDKIDLMLRKWESSEAIRKAPP